MKSTASNLILPWDYHNNGPEKWATLTDEFKKAGAEPLQSPIALGKSELTSGALPDSLTFHYQATIFEKSLQTYTLHLLPTHQENTIVWQDVTYILEDIHFHIPSEHTLDDKASEIEFHFVHRNQQDELLVIGCLYNQSETISGLFDTGLSEEQHWYESADNISFDPRMLLPVSPSFYYYHGSLTTPPTVSGVKWLVMDDIYHIQPHLFLQLKNFLQSTHNNRPLQPAFHRMVCHCPNH